jgi:hypothetical protein
LYGLYIYLNVGSKGQNVNCVNNESGVREESNHHHLLNVSSQVNAAAAVLVSTAAASAAMLHPSSTVEGG